MIDRCLGQDKEKVKEWMAVMYPSEPQLDLIDENLTFKTLSNSLEESHLCAKLLPHLDSHPRELIVKEAFIQHIERIMQALGMPFQKVVQLVSQVNTSEYLCDEYLCDCEEKSTIEKGEEK